MPLSEDEERILQQIEQEFYESDPAIAQQLEETTIYRHSWRNIKWSLLGFALGLLALVLTLSTSFVVAFGGFLMMLACALIIERNARKMGRAGFEAVSNTLQSGRGLRQYLGSASERMRNRMRPDEDG